jgi:GNAT superfamily N-acetyltransferase
MNITYQFATKEELNNLMKDDQFEMQGSRDVYKGFTLFSPTNTKLSLSYEHVYVLAFEIVGSERKVIGAIKLAYSGRYGDNVWYFSYIDIHKSYRGMGLARGLINFLNQSLNKIEPIVKSVFTPEFTEEGEKANVKGMLEEYITTCHLSFSYKELEEWEDSRSNAV